MSERPQISVLMCTYNSKQYLPMTIDSIINQTFKDFELVIVNDGSNDGSGELLEEYRQRDSRIKVFHIENKGISNARNFAIYCSKSDYITFVDSDDAIADNYLENLYDIAINDGADVVIGSMYRYIEKDKLYSYTKLENETTNEQITFEYIYKNYYSFKNDYNILFTTVWGKLFKKQLFSGITFPTDRVNEDSFVIYKILYMAQRIFITNKYLYMYRIRSGSIMTSGWTKEKIRSLIEQHEERIALLSAVGIEITKENIDDYKTCLYMGEKYALENGFIDDYNFIKQKIMFLNYIKKQN